jgi:enoyl-CoA hydratase/carnithine racemase
MTGSQTNYDRFTTVKIEFEDGVAWVILNRPDKRNAMSPTLNREMMDVLDALEVDDRCAILVITGAGESLFGRHGHQGVFPRGRQSDADRRDARAARVHGLGGGG